MAGDADTAFVGGRLYQFLLTAARRADLALSPTIGADHVLSSLMLAVPELQQLIEPPRPIFAAGIRRILVLAVLLSDQQLRQAGMSPPTPAGLPVRYELGATYPPAPGIAAGFRADGVPHGLDPTPSAAVLWPGRVKRTTATCLCCVPPSPKPRTPAAGWLPRFSSPLRISATPYAPSSWSRTA
jgi:hypothetical protein